MTRFRTALVLAALLVAVFTVGRATADDPTTERAAGSVRYVDIELRAPGGVGRVDEWRTVRCPAGKPVNLWVVHRERDTLGRLPAALPSRRGRGGCAWSSTGKTT